METLERLVRRLGEEGLVAAGVLAEPDTAVLTEISASARPGAFGARAWADACDGVLSGSTRAATGAHATPWPLADWLARALPSDDSQVILDPACGTGHLLVAAAARQNRPPERWLGWDVEPSRAASTRIALWLAGGARGVPADYAGIRTLDALLEAPPVRADLILANPPFVSIRALSRGWGEGYVATLREELPALTGNFDLYVAFLLRLRGWLRPSGRFGVILPATFWSAAYAQPARSTLAGRVGAAHRLRGRSVFPEAAVTTHLLLGGAEPIATLSLFATDLDALSEGSRREAEVPSGALAGPGFPLHSTIARVATVPLGEVAEVTAGTPGYHAAAVGAGLRERSESELAEGGPKALPFVVTRSIDRYRIELGSVRFQRRRWARPELRLDVLSPGKRALFEAPKVLVAGISRQLEAARDAEGLALGVGVYAVLPHRLPTELVLALLNSRVISDWYQRRFLGRELSGGYFAVNVGHLRQVPVPTVWLNDGEERDRLIALVREREGASDDGRCADLDDELDELVAKALGGGGAVLGEGESG